VLLEILPRINTNAVVVRHGNAAKLSAIPDSSVDFVFADPPFGGNIFYADASLLWEGWLRSYTDVFAEMVIHRRSKSVRQADGFVFKELEDYSRDMTSVFREMFRVLKPGRWAVIEFNNSDGAVFEAIKRAVTDSGFEIANMLLLDKQQKSFKQVQGVLGKEEVVDKDVLSIAVPP
jgi:DNA modification methylase